MAGSDTPDIDKERLLAETRKLSAEALKLQAEARDLDRTPWQRPGAWIALGSGLVALVAGLITIPSGYFARLRTIAEQQQEISRQQGELSQKAAAMAEQKRAIAEDRASALAGQIQADNKKIVDIQKQEAAAKNDLASERVALNSVTRQRETLERMVFARTLAEAAWQSISSDPDRSLVLAMHAVNTERAQNESPIPQAVDVLRQAIFSISRIPFGFVNSENDIGEAIAWSRGGTRVAFSREGTVILDAEKWRPIPLPALPSGDPLVWVDDDHLLIETFEGQLGVHISNQQLDHIPVRAYDHIVAYSGDFQSFLVLSTISPSPGAVPITLHTQIRKCSSRDITSIAGNFGVAEEAEWRRIDGCPVALPQSAYLSDLAINPNLSRVAFVMEDKLCLADLEQGRTVRQVPFPKVVENLNHDQLSWSPQERYLGIARKDGTAEIRDGQSLEPVSALVAPGLVGSITWTRDERYMILATTTHLIFWDTTKHRIAFQFQINEKVPIGASLSPDGTKFVMVDLGTNASVYSLEVLQYNSVDDLMNLARTQVTGNLTSDDCKRLLHRDVCPPIP